MSGLLSEAGRSQITWTQATPTVSGLYGQVGKLYSTMVVARGGLPPDTLILHPRRWSWILSQADTTGRPLVEPSGTASLNAMGSADSAGTGRVGMCRHPRRRRWIVALGERGRHRRGHGAAHPLR